ncbi:farnesyl pyrophosphate synthase-like [Diabrotica undecimpunctata]|uniref:farnesyl pyrophosphate synthase-like n=1 Tax=Diabrotica undecimpunctata TaxID=50387 RepID=UPI003B631FBF
MLKKIIEKRNFLNPLKVQSVLFRLQSESSHKLDRERLPYNNRRTELDWSVEENALQAVVQQIKKDVLDDQLEDFIHVPHLRQRYSKLLDKTTFDLPCRYHSCVLATVHSYLQVEKFGNLTPHQLKLSCILGWCYRLQVSSMIVYDDILDEQKVRYNEKPWHKKVGTKEAILDSLFLKSSASYLFLRYFESHPQFLNMLKIFNKCYGTCTVAQMLEIQAHNLKDFKANEVFVKSFPVTLYPVRAAMYLANIVDPKLHFALDEFCLDLAKFIKVEDDMWGAFEPMTKTHKDCTDVSTGRVTWLGIQVDKYGTQSQKEKFCENYGKGGEIAKRDILSVYEEIGIQEHYKTYVEEFYNTMCEKIEKLPKQLPKQVFIDLLDFAVIKKFRG